MIFFFDFSFSFLLFLAPSATRVEKNDPEIRIRAHTTQHTARTDEAQKITSDQ